MADCLVIISTTVDAEATAQDLARKAVGDGLAACAQVEPGITSHYKWEGLQQESREWRILFKTVPGRKEALVDWILANHPYEVPEILVWPVESANPAYTQWARNM